MSPNKLAAWGNLSLGQRTGSMKSSLKMRAALAALTIMGGASFIVTAADAKPHKAAAAPAPKPALGEFGIILGQGDPATKPGDDFNRYANGKWLDSFEIPSDLSTYGSFTKLSLDAEKDIQSIIEELAAKQSEPGSIEQKVGDYFKTWMDVDTIETQGLAPLKAELAKIAAIKSRADLMKAYGDLELQGPVGFGIYPDPADPTRYTVGVGQGGLGLPDRDYYLKTDERYVQYRDAYKAYIAKVMGLAGFAKPDAIADKILAFETSIAQAHWSRIDSRDIKKTYNPMTLAQLKTLAPQIDWALITNELGVSSVPSFVVNQPSAVTAEAALFAKADTAFLKNYIAFHFINDHAQFLTAAFDDARFDFYGKTLAGVKEQRERWKRGVNLVNGSLGEAVGQVYVQRHFPADYKEKMQALVKNLTDALQERIEHNPWMDDATRKAALVKLSTFEPRIGYPDEWIDYSSLAITPGALLGNAMAVNAFRWQDQVSQLGKPVNRKRWGYPPQTINASYNPLMNNITFPAGILQPPFFDPNADPAVNYGGIGAVIGHEIGHGFDDQGRQFDETGKLRDWWTPAAGAEFTKRADALAAQYDTYEVIPGVHLKGKLTLGENIGDLGGMQMAYAAYHRYLDQTSGGKAPVIDGLTGDQRFFLAWAQVWQGKSRDDEARRRADTDPHSSPNFRINGVVRNVDAWYAAFGVKPGDKLYLKPEDRIRIW